MNKVAALGPHLEIKVELSDKEILEGSRSVLIYWREQGAEKWNPFTGCPYQEPHWSEFYQNWVEVGRLLAPGTWPAAQKTGKKGATSRVDGGQKKKGQKSWTLGQSLPSGGGVEAPKNGPTWAVSSRKSGEIVHRAATRQEAVRWARAQGLAPDKYRVEEQPGE